MQRSFIKSVSLAAFVAISFGIYAYYTSSAIGETTKSSHVAPSFAEKVAVNAPPPVSQPISTVESKTVRKTVGKPVSPEVVVPPTVAAPTSPNIMLKARKGEEDGPKSKAERAFWSAQRDLFEFDMLKDPATGKIPKTAATEALRAAGRAKEFKFPALAGKENPTAVTIVPRGPNNLGGRTRAVAYDVRDNNIILAGGISGGIFRTTNGGTNWTKVTPASQVHNVSCVAQDPRAGNQDTWYYGGGEISGNSTTIGTSTYRGHGIWKSTDNGLTWTVLSSTQNVLENTDNFFDFCSRIVVNPTNGDVYVATGGSIQRSTDGGTTWTKVLGNSVALERWTDLIITPSGRLYAAFTGEYSNFEGIWTSETGNSADWTRIAGTIGGVVTPSTWNAAGTYGRMVLAYAPSAPNIVYVMYNKNVEPNCITSPLPESNLFKYDQLTATWTDLSANMPDEVGCQDGNDPFATQEGYDMCIAVRPNDPNTVVIGGTNIYRSTDGFSTTTNTKRIGGYADATSYAAYANHHPDIHVLLFADNNTLISGSDGGVHKCDITQSTAVWTSFNTNFVTYQYYHIDINPNMAGGTVISGGAQDNGTTICPTGTQHTNIYSGDGGQTQWIQYTSSSNYDVFVSSQEGDIQKKSPTDETNVKPAGSPKGIFVTYYHLDPDNTDYLYYASNNRIYKTRKAATLASTAVTGDPATGWQLMTNTTSGNIRCMATSRNNAYADATYSATNSNRVLYIGTETGSVMRLDDPAFAATGASFVNITPASASAGVVSSIAVNPFDDNEIMVTYSNYNAISVFHTTDAKAATPTWTEVEGPAAGAVALGSARSCIITKVNNVNTYFVGNSTGLFCTQALSGATTVWDRVGSSDIRYAVCSAMRLRVTDNKIALGTHGNGSFELQLPIALPVEWLSFEGKNTENGNELTWVVASEVNNKGFEMERQTEKGVWENIGFVASGARAGVYSFTDKNPAQLTYYRIKQVDNDGSFSYSKVISIQLNTPNTAAKIYPTLVSNQLTLENVRSFKIVNAAGQIVLSQNNFEGLTIDMQTLASGMYVISGTDTGGGAFSQKIVKK